MAITAESKGNQDNKIGGERLEVIYVVEDGEANDKIMQVWCIS